MSEGWYNRGTVFLSFVSCDSAVLISDYISLCLQLGNFMI